MNTITSFSSLSVKGGFELDLRFIKSTSSPLFKIISKILSLSALET